MQKSEARNQNQTAMTNSQFVIRPFSLILTSGFEFRASRPPCFSLTPPAPPNRLTPNAFLPGGDPLLHAAGRRVCPGGGQRREHRIRRLLPPRLLDAHAGLPQGH